MKKLLLVLAAIFSLVLLPSCGPVSSVINTVKGLVGLGDKEEKISKEHELAIKLEMMKNEHNEALDKIIATKEANKQALLNTIKKDFFEDEYGLVKDVIASNDAKLIEKFIEKEFEKRFAEAEKGQNGRSATAVTIDTEAPAAERGSYK